MVVGEAAMPVSDQLVETLTGTASEVDNRCKIACVHDLGIKHVGCFRLDDSSRRLTRTPSEAAGDHRLPERQGSPSVVHQWNANQI